MEPEEKPKSSKINKPAENVASIPDLVIEFLIRLPIRFFLYFKSVSKEWQSLITNQVTRRHQTPHHNPAIGLFLPTRNNNDPFEYLPFFAENSALKKVKDHNSPLIRILSSCNGLLLCLRATKDFVVYNPTTNQFFSALPRLQGNIVGMSLVFDPAISPDHYKVVIVHHQEILIRAVRQYCFMIRIYSSKNPSALRSSGVIPYIPYVDFSNGVYWNNAIHWISLSGADSLYFNIHRGVLNKMPSLPLSQIYHGGPRNYYFGESCDHLHYIQIYMRDFQFDIYEMKRDYSEWFVKYHVDLSLLLSANPLVTPHEMARIFVYGGYSYQFNILSVVRGDQEEEEDASFLVVRIFKKVIRYNIVPKTSETLHEYEDMALSADFVRYQRINAFQYIESLCVV